MATPSLTHQWLLFPCFSFYFSLTTYFPLYNIFLIFSSTYIPCIITFTFINLFFELELELDITGGLRLLASSFQSSHFQFCSVLIFPFFRPLISDHSPLIFRFFIRSFPIFSTLIF